jgi:hypothetical protein
MDEPVAKVVQTGEPILEQVSPLATVEQFGRLRHPVRAGVYEWRNSLAAIKVWVGG